MFAETSREREKKWLIQKRLNLIHIIIRTRDFVNGRVTMEKDNVMSSNNVRAVTTLLKKRDKGIMTLKYYLISFHPKTFKMKKIAKEYKYGRKMDKKSDKTSRKVAS